MVPNNMNIAVVWFNRSLYQRSKTEAEQAGRPVPPEPFVGWTWWDYAGALGQLMQRRGTSGNFLSFGASQPAIEDLYIQIACRCAASTKAFDALSDAQRAEQGLTGLTWEDCVARVSYDAEGKPVFYPNRDAIQQAIQFNYDLQHVVQASPTASDARQMSSSGLWRWFYWSVFVWYHRYDDAGEMDARLSPG